jgi:hypothetical protein
MARRATPVPPPQVPVVDAATVALEARRSAAAVRKRKNTTDLASTQVHVQRLREENLRPNTRSTHNKYWRLWRVSAGASRRPPRPSPFSLSPSPYRSDADGAGTGVIYPARLRGRRAGMGEEVDLIPHRRRPLHPANEAIEASAR